MDENGGFIKSVTGLLNSAHCPRFSEIYHLFRLTASGLGQVMRGTSLLIPCAFAKRGSPSPGLLGIVLRRSIRRSRATRFSHARHRCVRAYCLSKFFYARLTAAYISPCTGATACAILYVHPVET